MSANNNIISTHEDPSLRIESSAIINLRGVSTKLNKYIVFTMQTYKKLNYNYILMTYFITWHSFRILQIVKDHDIAHKKILYLGLDVYIYIYIYIYIVYIYIYI